MWDLHHKPAIDENPKNAILLADYLKVLNRTYRQLRHIIQAPLSSVRFHVGVVAAMQKKRILGVTSRHVLILNSLKAAIKFGKDIEL